MIENRLIKLSKNKNIFDDNIWTYKNALNKLNFKHRLTDTTYFNGQKKNRADQKIIIYFNLPFCECVKTNAEKIFYELINKHF